MNPQDPNVLLLEVVSSALGALRERVVFVGGCAVGLMITDTARPPVRATQDVDLIVEIHGTVAYYQLEQQLKKAGLVPDHDVICRWRLGDLKVDVMPTDENILGFSNRWYPDAIRHAQLIALPSGRQIRLISPPLLLATKIEAFYDRGAGDFGASHDIEDIVNLIDGRPELPDEVMAASADLLRYLKEEFDDLLATRFVDVIGWHLGSQEQSRSEVVIERMRKIAGL